MIKRFNLSSLCGLLALVLLTLPVQAQDREDENTTVIEITKDGSVTINGEAMDTDRNAIDVDGAFVIRMKDDNGDTIRVYRSADDRPNVFTRFRGLDDDDIRLDLEDFFADRDMDAQLQFRRGVELNNLFRGPNGVRWGSGTIGPEYRVFSSDDDAALSVFGNRLSDLSREAEQEQLKNRVQILKLEREAAALAQQARRTSGAEREELEAELDAQLDDIFEMKMELRQAEIKLLEEQLAEARTAFEKRSAERERMIERRKRELLGERDALDW
ncbi:MAG: hypothetical protein AAGJ10_02120 [Bacteroidota bacterium]